MIAPPWAEKLHHSGQKARSCLWAGGTRILAGPCWPPTRDGGAI